MQILFRFRRCSELNEGDRFRTPFVSLYSNGFFQNGRVQFLRAVMVACVIDDRGATNGALNLCLARIRLCFLQFLRVRVERKGVGRAIYVP